MNKSREKTKDRDALMSYFGQEMLLIKLKSFLSETFPNPLVVAIIAAAAGIKLLVLMS